LTEVDYDVVVNDEGQFSIWPAHLSTPLGWRPAGKSGGRSECLEYVAGVWTDLRPLSLRDGAGREERA
jgi:MbtH protein